ncbi:hypothetical protein IJF81_00110 [bacterium]|nr:hypothetical protein [bacterium]
MAITLPSTIKMIITDFDGVITDNCVYINEDFTMSRKLNFKDIMAFSLLKKMVTRLLLSQEKRIPQLKNYLKLLILLRFTRMSG